MKLLNLLAAGFVLANIAHSASYTTSWVGNNGENTTNYVGNAARSMWVSPEGIVYTASMWDENGRNIGIYQNGSIIGSMGGTKESQGSAIGGDGTWVFTAQQSPNGGKVGRYNRSTKARDLLFSVSATTTGGDVITGIAVANSLVYVSDFPGNRVRVFTTAGVFQNEWTVTEPGAIAIENGGANLWVARKNSGEIRRYSSTGVPGTVISMAPDARPGSLHINLQNELWVGDQGPDQNIKIYTALTGTPVQSSSYGIQGGYLSSIGGVRGQVGPKRFTRVVGIGSDNTSRIYVLNNPWGGSWDLGRNGATDLHCYIRNTGALSWMLQALNFEAVAAPDPGTNGTDLFSGNILYTGSGGAGYKGNTIDPFRYPADARIDTTAQGRGEHFGHVAYVSGKRILVACGQNADRFYTYYFNPATDGLVGIPGQVFGTPTVIRNGFCLASNGDVWTSADKTNAIQRYPLTGFSATGAPIWGPVVSTPTPASIARLNRIEYLPPTDTMILAGGHTDWTLIGNRVEVYNGWIAGNRTPDVVITLSRAQAKSMSAAGSYLFVGYYAVNNVDVFDLTTGALVLTMTGTGGVHTGNDTDSMYGIKAYKKSNGQYMVVKDDYNTTKNVIYTFIP